MDVTCIHSHAVCVALTLKQLQAQEVCWGGVGERAVEKAWTQLSLRLGWRDMDRDMDCPPSTKQVPARTTR